MTFDDRKRFLELLLEAVVWWHTGFSDDVPLAIGAVLQQVAGREVSGGFFDYDDGSQLFISMPDIAARLEVILESYKS